MSGGHFNYQQYRIADIRTSIEEYINGEAIEPSDVERFIKDWFHDPNCEEAAYIRKHHHTMPNRNGYSEATVNEFYKAVELLRMAETYVERIDYLLSGDDSEKSFHRRLKEDLEKPTK